MNGKSATKVYNYVFIYRLGLGNFNRSFEIVAA